MRSIHLRDGHIRHVREVCVPQRVPSGCEAQGVVSMLALQAEMGIDMIVVHHVRYGVIVCYTDRC